MQKEKTGQKFVINAKKLRYFILLNVEVWILRIKELLPMWLMVH